VGREGGGRAGGGGVCCADDRARVAVERWLEQAQVMERAGGGVGSDGEKVEEEK